jgi:hypothetical protein
MDFDVTGGKQSHKFRADSEFANDAPKVAPASQKNHREFAQFSMTSASMAL